MTAWKMIDSNHQNFDFFSIIRNTPSPDRVSSQSEVTHQMAILEDGIEPKTHPRVYIHVKGKLVKHLRDMKRFKLSK